MKRFKVVSTNDLGQVEKCDMSFFQDDDTPDDILKQKIIEQVNNKGGNIVSVELWDESKGAVVWQ